MSTLKTLVIAGCSLLLVACAGPRLTPEQLHVQETADRVARWQLAHMDDFDYIRTFRDHTAEEAGWVQAAFYIGLARWQAVTDNHDYRQALQAKAEANRWRLGPLYWHADDQAMGQVYLYLADITGGADIDPMRADFDRILAAQPQNPLVFVPDPSGKSEGTCQWRWCWSDALFMAPPAWAALSRITGDSRYRDYALSEFHATTDYLYDADAHLYYRDSRFFERRSEHGNKVFWSRGNGWVFAGLPLLLEQLPGDHPDRDWLLTLYREMAHAFLAIQTPEGYWASSLLDWRHDPLPESSGTAFITFGFAWGVNRDLLPAAEFDPAIKRAWEFLEASVNEEGKLGWVQQVGNAPDEVRASDTQLYGAGALLLAASELIRRDD